MEYDNSRGISLLTSVVLILIVLIAAAAGVYGYSLSTKTMTSLTTVSSTSVFTSLVTTTMLTNQVVPLRIFAAASFTPALQALQSSYQRNYSISLIYNFASSSALEMQIAQGVPADVFMSADVVHNTMLKNSSLLANGNTYQTLVYNYVALFVPANNPKNITTLADLLKPGVRVAIGAPASVPAGAYAVQVWNNIGAKWGNVSSPDFVSSVYTNFSQAISSHIVSQTTDVEAAITQVLTGAADAAFGYVSDGIANAAQLKAISIPSDINAQAIYTISVIRSSQHPIQANAFVAWLLSPPGQSFLEKWGFTMLSAS